LFWSNINKIHTKIENYKKFNQFQYFDLDGQGHQKKKKRKKKEPSSI
jgi:hypothetical protein